MNFIAECSLICLIHKWLMCYRHFSLDSEKVLNTMGHTWLGFTELEFQYFGIPISIKYMFSVAAEVYNL